MSEFNEESTPVEQIAESTPATAETVEPIVHAENPAAVEPEQVHDKVQKRIDQLTREKYEAKRAAEAAASEAAYMRQMIDQAQNANNQPDPNAIQAYVKQEAIRLHQETEFNKACNKVFEDGIKSVPGFETNLSNLQVVGLNRDILDVIVDSDEAARIINYLGTDLDEAARIISLPPVRMAREITKLEAKLASQTKQQSKAPEPIKPISGSAKNTKSPAEMSDDEYMKWRRSGR